MKAKYLVATLAVLLALGGLWLGRTDWHDSTTGIGQNTTNVRTNPEVNLQPPNPNRRYQDLTPEQRVQRARQPQDIGG